MIFGCPVRLDSVLRGYIFVERRICKPGHEKKLKMDKVGRNGYEGGIGRDSTRVIFFESRYLAPLLIP